VIELIIRSNYVRVLFGRSNGIVSFYVMGIGFGLGYNSVVIFLWLGIKTRFKGDNTGDVCLFFTLVNYPPTA